MSLVRVKLLGKFASIREVLGVLLTSSATMGGVAVRPCAEANGAAVDRNGVRVSVLGIAAGCGGTTVLTQGEAGARYVPTGVMICKPHEFGTNMEQFVTTGEAGGDVGGENVTSRFSYMSA